MKLDITIGWTIHPLDDRASMDYMPFMDSWKPGQPQHTETVTITLPDGADPAYPRTGLDIAEAAFVATNAPFVTTGTLAAQIADGIAAAGYHGEGAHYSLSVGDTVEVAGIVYACASMGWEQVAA